MLPIQEISVSYLGPESACSNGRFFFVLPHSVNFHTGDGLRDVLVDGSVTIKLVQRECYVTT